MQPGAAFTADPADYVSGAEDSEVRVRKDSSALTCGGVPVRRLLVDVASDQVRTIVVELEDSRELDAVRGLSDELCRAAGTETDRHTPSPPGTPGGEEDWDPALLTIGSCAGPLGTSELEIREEHNHSFDDPGSIAATIWLRAASKAEK